MIAWIIRKSFGNLTLAVDLFKELVAHLQALGSQMFGWLTPVWLDGWLYVSIAGLGFQLTFLGGDDVYKYWNPQTVFFWKWFFGTSSAVSGALKMFRSNSYAEHVKEKKDFETKQFTKP